MASHSLWSYCRVNAPYGAGPPKDRAVGEKQGLPWIELGYILTITRCKIISGAFRAYRDLIKTKVPIDQTTCDAVACTVLFVFSWIIPPALGIFEIPVCAVY